MSEAWDLFTKYANVSHELTQRVRYYKDVQVQARVHPRKNRRLQKKWLKRYGYKTKSEFAGFMDRTVRGPYDITCEKGEQPIIELRLTARVMTDHSTRVARPLHVDALDFNDPKATIPIQTTTYTFPKLCQIVRLSEHILPDFFEHEEMRHDIFNRFLSSCRPLVENGTKVNGQSGYGELEEDTIYI